MRLNCVEGTVIKRMMSWSKFPERRPSVLIRCFCTTVFISGCYWFCCCLLAEGDLYFTVKLQSYTAVEKDEVILSCELSKAVGEVKWFKDGSEIYPSKNIIFQSDGKKRLLVIKKAAKSNVGAYTCDCGTDKTTADLNIEGNVRGDPAPPPHLVKTAESGPASLWAHLISPRSSITVSCTPILSVCRVCYQNTWGKSNPINPIHLQWTL